MKKEKNEDDGGGGNEEAGGKRNGRGKERMCRRCLARRRKETVPSFSLSLLDLSLPLSLSLSLFLSIYFSNIHTPLLVSPICFSPHLYQFLLFSSASNLFVLFLSIIVPTPFHPFINPLPHFFYFQTAFIVPVGLMLFECPSFLPLYSSPSFLPFLKGL